MNRLSIVSAAVLFFPFTNISAGQTTDSSYTLTGTIKGVPTAWVYLLHAETKKLDFARISNNTFVFSGTAGTPEFCMLGFPGQHPSSYIAVLGLAAIKKDKDGKIIAKGLHGDDLEKKLAELVH